MRIRNLIFMLVAIVATMAIPPTSSAENNGGNTCTTTLRISKNPKRPKMPGQITITVTYRDGMMEFELPKDASHMDVSIKLGDSEDISYGIVTTDSPILPITLGLGEYTITCTTNLNQIFTGTLYL